MSHFTQMKTKLTDPECIVLALADLGYSKVENNPSGSNLYGYQGDTRKDVANIIIRRQYVGQASNDIGFQRQSDGSYMAIISEFDRPQFDVTWLNKLNQRHAYHVTKKTLQEQGYVVTNETFDDRQQIHLELRRMG